MTFNQVVLAGYLTKDPELTYTSGGKTVAHFVLAVNSPSKEGEADFIEIDAWERTAELCGEYLHKGSPALISGRLKQDRWQDEHGNKRSKLKVVAGLVQFLGQKESQEPSSAMSSSMPPF